MTDPAPLSTAGHLRWLLGFWRPQRGFLALLLFFTLVSSAVAVSYPLVLRDVIDSIGGPATGLERVLLILGLIAFVVAIQNMGYSVTGLLAGLGVGGLALAANLAGMIFGNEGNEIFFALWLLVNGLGWIGLGALLMLGDKRAAYHTGATA